MVPGSEGTNGTSKMRVCEHAVYFGTGGRGRSGGGPGQGGRQLLAPRFGVGITSRFCDDRSSILLEIV